MPSLVRSTAYNAIGSATILGSGFLTTLIAARLLGATAVGLVAFVTMIVSIALAVMDLGLPGAMTRFLPELQTRALRNEHAVAAMVLVPYLGLTLIGALVLFLMLRLTGVNVGTDRTAVLYIIAASVTVQSLAAFHYGALKGERRFEAFAILASLSAVLQLAAAVYGARTYGTLGVLAAPAVGFALPASAGLARLRHLRSISEAQLFRRLVKFSSHTWVFYVLTAIASSRIEIYFLRNAWGDHEAGLFAAGTNLANLALQGPMFLTGALLPHLAARHAADPRSLEPAFARALTYFSVLLFPLTLCAAALAPVLVPLLFGASFHDGVPTATVLIAGNSAMAIIAITQQFAFASDRTGAMLAWSCATAALTLVSGFTLAQYFGAFGAAWGRAGILFASAAILLLAARAWRWHVPFGSLAKILGASVALALATAFLVAACVPRSGFHP